MSILYVLHCNGHYKIGITTSSVAKRIRSLQTGNAHKISVYWYKKCSNFIEMEKYFHNRFAHKRLVGEWFNLNKDDLAYIKKCKKFSMFTQAKSRK
jgi:hypothetical protein